MKKALFDVQSLMNVVQADRPTRVGMPGDRLDDAIRPNVMIGVETLQTLQPIVAPAVPRGQVKVVGAVSDLLTGGVALAV